MESKPDSKQAREATFRGNELAARLLGYSVRIVRVVENMPKTRTGNHVAAQLLRAGTSPLSNHGEAQAAESMLDFIHKLRICLKELRETQRWLLLAKEVPLIRPPTRLDGLIQETDELIRIFVSSIQTSRAKIAKKRKQPEP
ncbi:MAG TPA: four helix bundle protein [Planctomycetota bacterium]|nr:four helix bundle protein [Planctomycetota bacterium]